MSTSMNNQRFRYRVTPDGLLVLQIWVTTISNCSNYGFDYIWRDARVEDITVGKVVGL